MPTGAWAGKKCPKHKKTEGEGNVLFRERKDIGEDGKKGPGVGPWHVSKERETAPEEGSTSFSDVKTKGLREGGREKSSIKERRLCSKNSDRNCPQEKTPNRE